MTAYAQLVTQSLYDVTYDGSRGIDRCMPDTYLERLARRGYTVLVHASMYGPAQQLRVRADGTVEWMSLTEREADEPRTAREILSGIPPHMAGRGLL